MIVKGQLPNFSYENLYWQDDFVVIGIDEVGRGAFAGPVGVGGVAFSSNLNSKDIRYLLSLGINDSKKLSAKKREYLADIIKVKALVTHVAFIDVEVINEIGIGKATFLGMKEVARAISKKVTKPLLLIDAFEIPDFHGKQKGIVHGDSLSISIASASIIAKVARDKRMCELAKDFPNYGFEKHKGYGTAFHRQEILESGLSQHHRVDFCRNTLRVFTS